MELVFQEERIAYLCSILSDSVNQEQTADVIIPDSYPDCERIVDAFGTVLLRSEECASGSASVAGFVQAGVLYVGSEGELRRVQTEIPFSLRRDFAPQERCMMQCVCTLQSVDARILNSRKILLRVGLSCDVQVLAPKDCLCYDVTEEAPNLQLKRRQIPMRMPLDVGERSFVLNEELELPSDKPEISHLLKCLYRTQVLEQKMVGNKAVFKGGVTVHALYESADGSLHSHDWSLPFSQYAQMEQHLDDCEPQTLLTLTGADTEPDSQLDSRRLLTSINLLAQCTALGVRNVKLIEDAFCTDGNFVPQWQEERMTGILDRQSFRETAASQKELPIASVVDVWAYPKPAVKQRVGDKMQVEAPVSCSVLYRDTEGQLQQEMVQMPLSVQTELNENASCKIRELELGEIFSTAGGGTLSLRLPVSFTLESRAEHALHAVSGGEVTPWEEHKGQKPAVILRFTESSQEVWEIAKACRTPVEEICKANELSSDMVEANTLLLIPMK